MLADQADLSYPLAKHPSTAIIPALEPFPTKLHD